MKKVFLSLVFILFSTNMFCTGLQDKNNSNDLIEFQNNSDFQEYSDLLTLIETSCLQVKEILICEPEFCNKNVVLVEAGSYRQIFGLLQNIFSMTLDFSEDYSNQNTRKTVLLAFADLASDLFNKVNLEKVKQKYPEEDFDFWKDFIGKQTLDERNNFIINSFDSFERKRVVNVVREVVLVLSHYLLNCVDFTVESLHNAMSCYYKNEDILKNKDKKKKTAALIFGAIANICMQAGKLVNKPAQQGVLALFGTVFGTASQIVEVHAKDELEITELTEEKKSRFVNQVLSSKLTQKILSGIFAVVQNYLHEKMDDFLDYLSVKLIDLICHRESSNEGEVLGNNFSNNLFDNHKDDDDE